MISLKRVLAVLVGTAAIWASSAQAAIIVSFSGVGQTQPGIFTWAYTASLQPDQLMLEQDYFTIYDFPDITTADVSFLTTFSPATTGRTFSSTVQDSGVTPPLASVTDNDHIPNVTIRLTGGGTVDPSVAPPGPVTLGTVLINSTTNIPSPPSVNPPADFKNYATLAHVPSGVPGIAPLPSTDVGVVPVAIAVPEPASVLAMILGLVGLGAYSIRRREGGGL